jgi:hypothetical protein
MESPDTCGQPTCNGVIRAFAKAETGLGLERGENSRGPPRCARWASPGDRGSRRTIGTLKWRHRCDNLRARGHDRHPDWYVLIECAGVHGLNESGRNGLPMPCAPVTIRQKQVCQTKTPRSVIGRRSRGHCNSALHAASFVPPKWRLIR